MAVTAGAAQARSLADLDRGDIGDPHDQAVPVDDRRLSQIFHGGGQGVGADRQSFASALDIACAGLSVGAIEGLDKVAHAQAVGGKARRVRTDRILLHIAADGVDAGETGGGPHLRRDDPVLHGAQIGGALLRGRKQIAFGRQIGSARLPARLARLGEVLTVEWLVVDRPHQHFTEARGDRGHGRLHPVRHGLPGAREPFGDLLAREIDVGLVGKDDRDLAEAVSAEGSGRGQAGNAGHGGFNRVGDLSFDLFRRERRSDRGHLDLAIGDVRHGVDGKPCQFEQSVGRDKRRGEDHEPSEFNREFDDEFEHAVRP